MTFIETLSSVPVDKRDHIVKMLRYHDIDHEGHASCLIELYPHEFRYVSTHGWYHWHGTHWKLDPIGAAASRAVVETLAARRSVAAGMDDEGAKKVIQASRAQAFNVRGIVTMLANKIEVEAEQSDFDRMPDHLNLINGTLDLRTGWLDQHRASDHLTYCLDIPYDAPEKGERPRPEIWLNFLDSLGFNREMIDYLQLSIGYTLTGRTSERAMWYLHGPPASGKSTIGEVLLNLLGHKPLAAGVGFSTFTSKRYGDTQMFDMAPLKPARLIVASESGRYEKINEAVIKAITGGEEIYCAHKGKAHFSYRPQFKIWLTSNFPPLLDVDDDAAWDRVKLINMSRSFLGKEDKGLKHTLISPRILREILPWAVEGAMRWYELGVGGLTTPEFIRNSTQGAREEMDTVGLFLKDTCKEGDPEEFFYEGKSLYTHYEFYCEDEGHKPKSRRSFTQSLKNKGIESVSRRVGKDVQRVYAGVQFKGL